MSVIEEIKENLDIVEVVSDHVRLEKAGRRHKALCPFHAEKTPSFIVFPDSQRWHCFGACNEGGDVFDFVEKINNWDLSTALEELARRAGVELKPLTEEEKATIEERRSYEDALGTLADHLGENLANSQRATAYAHGRGWSDETIKAERLGYADGGPLPELGNERAQRVARNLNGWAGDVGGAVIYAHRRRGRVVYFAGRSIEGKAHHNPLSDLAGPKRAYTNAAYSSSVDDLVIVEGQACAISLGDFDIPALALAGCGLSGGLGKRLQKHTERDATIYLVPDGDDNTRVESVAEVVGPELVIVELPEGVEDINDWHQAGATVEDVRAAMYEANTWLDLEIERVAGVNGRRATAERRKLFGVLADLDTFALESYYRGRVKDELGLKQSQFNRLLKAARGEMVEEIKNGNGERPRYIVNDGRLCAVKYNGKGERYTEPLCNFAAEVAEDVALDDGSGEPERTFRIKGTLDDGTPLPTVQVPADKFPTMAWIQESWGIRAVTRAGYSKRDQLREAIQLQSENAERRHVFTHTGWREVDGERVYLHAGGAVGADDVEVELDAVLSRYDLPTEPENVKEAVEASLRFLEVAPETITVPLWAMVYLAPVTEILEPAFLGWLYGVTGTHKSTLAALALSHWGRFNYKNLPVDWVDTAYSLEMVCFRAKDTLLVIDDFAPQSDRYRARKMDSNASYIVRAVGNRSGRGRLNANLTQRPVHPPRGMVLATGEQLPAGQSDNARLLTVELHDGDVHLGRLSASQEEANRYPHAMAGYAQWLAGEWEHLTETLPAMQRKQRKRLIDEMHDSHRRVPDTLATLYLGFDLGLAYAVEVGALAEAEAQDLRKRGWVALKRGASDQARRVERQRPTEIFLNALGNLMALGRVYLESSDGDGQIGGGAAGSEGVGWYDDEYVYLLTATYNHVARFLRDEGTHFPIKSSALKKHLEDEGFLVRETDNRYTSRLTVGDGQRRALRLKRTMVARYIDLLSTETEPPEIEF
jgi:DNA primase